MYWLKLLKRSDLIKGDKNSEAIHETEQLISIIAKSVITAKKNR